MRILILLLTVFLNITGVFADSASESNVAEIPAATTPVATMPTKPITSVPTSVKTNEANIQAHLNSNELEIAPAPNDQHDADFFRYKMGQSLTIIAVGNSAERIRYEMQAHQPQLALYLDRVEMSNLKLSAMELGNGKLELTIKLARDPEDDSNRKAWDSLFAKHLLQFKLNIPVGLAGGNDLPVAVMSTLPFQFYVAQKSTILIVAILGVAAFFLIYGILINNPSALRDGRDGPYSLGKSQMAFWGLFVLLGFACVWLITGTMERIPMQVLALLGISGMTGLGAVVIGKSKKAANENEIESRKKELLEEQEQLAEKREASPSLFPQESVNRLITIEKEIKLLKIEPRTQKKPSFWRDICDDGNGMSFHRLQVVLWTLMLGAIFIHCVALRISMPEFPETLLALMGISNGTYLGFKLPERA